MPFVTFDLNYTLGALEIALNVSAFLLGCCTVQAYIYYRNFPSDPLFMKLVVALIWVLEVGAHIGGSQTVYKYTVIEWGRPLGLLQQSRALIVTVYLTAIVTPIVESFYLYRIYRFAGVKCLPFVLLGEVLVWVRYAGWVILSMQVDVLGVVDGRLLDRWSWLIITQLSVGAGMDAVVSLTIVYFLWKKRNTGIGRSTKIIDHLVRWTLQTGLMASAAFLTTLATFLARRDTLIWLGMLAVLSKVFSNCFYASLNARRAILNGNPQNSGLANIPLSSYGGDTWQTQSPVSPVSDIRAAFSSRDVRFTDTQDPIIDITISKEVHRVCSPE